MCVCGTARVRCWFLFLFVVVVADRVYVCGVCLWVSGRGVSIAGVDRMQDCRFPGSDWSRVYWCGWVSVSFLVSVSVTFFGYNFFFFSVY